MAAGPGLPLVSAANMPKATPTYNRVLRDAWESFCEELKGTADLIFQDRVPDTELDRASGLRYMSRYITKALEKTVEYADPLRPQLRVLQTPTNKTFGDNPDCTYWEATLDGSLSYRLIGNRGSVHWVRFVATSHDGTASVVTREQLRSEWDGSYVITIGPDDNVGPNHLLTVPGGPVRLFVRQFFGDWDTEMPMTGRLEAVEDHGPPPPLTAAAVADGLAAAVDFIREDSKRWSGYPEFYRDRPNQFVAGSPTTIYSDTRKMQIDSGRWVNFCYFDLGPDDLLLIRLRPPRCWHWIIELNNFWMNSVDYRYHLSSINMKQASAQANGTVAVVVSDEDLGISNWLDTAGHRSGLLIHRWVDASEDPLPQTEVIPKAKLHEVIGDDVRRVTPQERKEQLRRRKIGVDRRFPV